MEDFIKDLDINLKYVHHQIQNKTVTIIVESNKDSLICPYCNTKSNKEHSTYWRKFQDLPMQGKNVIIKLQNRKMFCDNPNCSNTTFAESFDFYFSKATKTNRLIDYIIDTAVNTSSIAAQNYLRKNGVRVGKSTICTFLKKRYTQD